MKDKTLAKGDFIYECTGNCTSVVGKQAELLSKYKKKLHVLKQ
jgi:hypothetical protein